MNSDSNLLQNILFKIISFLYVLINVWMVHAGVGIIAWFIGTAMLIVWTVGCLMIAMEENLMVKDIKKVLIGSYCTMIRLILVGYAIDCGVGGNTLKMLLALGGVVILGLVTNLSIKKL